MAAKVAEEMVAVARGRFVITCALIALSYAVWTGARLFPCERDQAGHVVPPGRDHCPAPRRWRFIDRKQVADDAGGRCQGSWQETMVERQGSAKTVIGLLRRRRLWIVGTIAAFLAAGGLLALVTPPTYEGSALMAIDQRVTSPSTDLTATVSTGQLLAANVTDPSPGRAADLANLLAAELLAEQHDEVANALQSTKVYLDDELKRLGDQLTTAKPPLVSALQAQYTAVYNRREAVSEQEARLDGSLYIVEPAAVPTRPAYSRARTFLLSALVVGVVAALIVALLVDRVDSRIYGAQALSDATAAPLVLAC